MSVSLPKVRSYGEYSSDNYGAHSLMFTDPKGNDFYFSYETLVAFRPAGHRVVIRKNEWGTTTGKHLNWIDNDKKSRLSGEDFQKKFNEVFGEGELPRI